VFPRGLVALCGVLLAGLGPAGAQERVQGTCQEHVQEPTQEHVAPEHANLVRPAAPVPDPFPVASDARLGGDAARTRLVMDLSRPIEIAASRSPIPIAW